MSTARERKQWLWTHLWSTLDSEDWEQLGLPDGLTEVEEARWDQSIREVKRECARKAGKDLL